ncbi:MAG: bifunctional 5,10-methylene-tetrahydrofolate dehydrogenase/5,10-methylene-tetrahydrofolate cyclohydrolase [Veillonellaceae bacterium]|nr:bifunctional 5,10-methylene-tetrahydrofolate dehydrogenase/5,10-methylene-tetrahydrofolate cyclohydrolase [Veillonellaceae bacterium]
MALLMEGKPAAAVLRARLAEKAKKLREQKISCGLAVLLVGDDHASIIYADWLGKLCGSLGISYHLAALPAETTQKEILALIEQLNRNPEVSGILPMMPLPRGIDPDVVVRSLDPDKDVDALHPLNVGLVAVGKSLWAPCTPRAVMTVLDHYKIPLAGKHAVIVGRSNVVGKPLSQLLLARDATVTICHSRTPDLPYFLRQADLVVAAAGKPRLITAPMIKPGAVVVDVGINDLEGRIVGDVDFEGVSAAASAITPVPGGIGTVSTVMVLEAVLRKWPD